MISSWRIGGGASTQEYRERSCREEFGALFLELDLCYSFGLIRSWDEEPPFPKRGLAFS